MRDCGTAVWPDETAESTPAVVAFLRDDESERAVAGSLAAIGASNARLLRLDIDGAIRYFGKQKSPALLIIDFSGEAEPVGQLRRLAGVCDPGTSVIVIGDCNDIVLYRILKDLGVSEYFFKPVVPDLLARACRIALTGEQVAPTPPSGKLVSIVGVRGGVGATTIAVSAAWQLAHEPRRRVALIDLDLVFGDAALQLNRIPNENLSEALRHPDRVDGAFLESIATRVSDRLDLFASLEPLDSTLRPEEEGALALLPKIRSAYRYVFVDMPRFASRGWHKLLDISAAVVLVSDQTMAAAREIIRWRERLCMVNAGPTVLHVLNKARGPGALSAGTFAKAVGAPPDVAIPFDARVAAAGKLGVAPIEQCRRIRPGMTRLMQLLSGDSPPPGPSPAARLAARLPHFGQRTEAWILRQRPS